MPEKAPLVPSDETFSATSAAETPPLADAPAVFSKQKTKIEVTEADLVAPPEAKDVSSESPTDSTKKRAGKEKKPAKKERAKKVAPPTPAPADEPPKRQEEEPEKEETPAVAKGPVVDERPIEVRREEAWSEYFKGVKVGSDFLQKLLDMPGDADFRKKMDMQVGELSTLSGALYQKVLDFYVEFESVKGVKNASELSQLREAFLSSSGLPAGCHQALRDSVEKDIREKLGWVKKPPIKSAKETKPTAPPPPPPSAPATGGAVGGAPFSYRQLSVDEVLDNLVKGAPAPAPTPTGEAPAPSAPTAEKPKSRIWNYIPKGAPRTPSAPTVSSTAETAPPAPSPKVESAAPASEAALAAEESKPSREWKYIPKGAVMPSAPAAPAPEAETTPPAPSSTEAAPERTARAEAAASLTREKIEALTFENLADLNDDELQAVVGATTLVSAGSWGKMMQGTPDSLVKRVRRAVNNQDYFDEMLKGPVETAERIRELRETQVSYTKDALLKASQLGSTVRTEMPEVIPATPLGAPEAPPPPPSSIETAAEHKELSFDDLSKLGKMSLQGLFYAAEFRDRPALLTVLSAHNELRGVMLAARPPAMSAEIEQEIAAFGSKTESEVREAEKVIVGIARERQQDGEISFPPSAESVVASGLTPEKIQSLTWENLFELNDDSLRVVVRASDSPSYSWGILMRNMPESLVL